MGELDENKSKIRCSWLFIAVETNVLLTMVVICGLKVLLWEAGRMLEELELKPTQPPTVVWLGLGLRVKFTPLAVRMCCKNRFDHVLLRTFCTRGHTAKKPKPLFVWMWISNIFTSSMKTIFEITESAVGTLEISYKLYEDTLKSHNTTIAKVTFSDSVNLC